jgi:hypothetical protein
VTSENRQWLVTLENVTWPDEEVLPTEHYKITQVTLDVHEPLVSTVISTVRHNSGVHGYVRYTHILEFPSDDLMHTLRYEREIGSTEYVRHITQHRDTTRVPLLSERTAFKWGQQTWFVDEFTHHNLSILSGSDLPEGDLSTPPWLVVIREITGECGWKETEMTHPNWEEPNADE